MRFNKIMILKGLIIILVILTFIALIFPSKEYSANGFEIKDSDVIDQIDKDKTIEQEFISDDNYSKVGIMSANYYRNFIKGNLVVKIANNNQIKKTYKVKLSSLMNDEYYFFKYRLRKNNKYRLIISVENNDYPIAIYTTSTKVKGATLKIDGEEKDCNIALSFLRKNNNYFNIWYYIFGITLILLLIVIEKKELKHEK